MSRILDSAKETIAIEAKSVKDLESLLTDDFEKAVKAIMDSKGKLIVTGMGKSGIIGRKLAATFSSTGTPSFFLHPGEAYHGDLGLIQQNDIVLAISNSGETDELLKILPYFLRNGNKIIGMSGNPASTLAKNTHFHLNVHVEEEACPLDLAPTSSTTATLVMGDALAVALMRERDFQPEHFALFHPGGSLGRRLLMRVKDVMRSTELPVIASDSKMEEVIQAMSAGRLGIAIIEDQAKLSGVITDGDLRRGMKNNKANFMDLQAKDIMTNSPKFIDKEMKLKEAELMMMEHKINTLLVAEDQKCIGVLQLYDL
ncbi:KpsF/GutQ family sugar-phosphate isomerase [Marivirga arenosa]|uniref:KpsF/GutQ family sugar-phosphate isomerase n=1 Tax=Marivirga arenosa TaxID=3059076 RepID=A0AA51R6T2_9BACT|nr:KpsF/GutQ family sugar-phosphate isomerase [Marivirga sp. ABR2-2]WMN06967.1 KpsF/GutQ family sugar-phosphate isomerase [Marivirga sp. ABR2-2]